jgi:N-dimethylarginine dimethylaminohydrolase
MGFTFAWPKRVLMVSPDYFRVDYAINPYMRDSEANLQSIDSARAKQQWQNLKQTFTDLGLSVEVLPGQPDFPDMVFCANTCLPFLDHFEKMHLVLSRIPNEQRRGEVDFMRAWAQENRIKNYTVTDFDFDGGGDAIWNFEKRELWGGYGFRSDRRAYDQIDKICPWKIQRVKLVDPRFYHLDTAFACLRADTVAYVPEAFDEPSRQLIESRFPNRLIIDVHEAQNHFAANCVSVDGRHVVLQKGFTRFVDQLRQSGFIPVETDVSEFLKSGGATFCMKQILF